jgi:hypothetical protein
VFLPEGSHSPVFQAGQNTRDGLVGHVPSDGIFDLELLLLLVESTANDVEIDGLNDEVLQLADGGNI